MMVSRPLILLGTAAFAAALLLVFAIVATTQTSRDALIIHLDTSPGDKSLTFPEVNDSLVESALREADCVVVVADRDMTGEEFSARWGLRDIGDAEDAILRVTGAPSLADAQIQEGERIRFSLNFRDSRGRLVDCPEPRP